MRSYSFLLLAAALAVALVSAGPEPGSLEIFVSVPSINNIVQLASSILPQYTVNEKTFLINYKAAGPLYKMEVDSIYIKNVVVNTHEVSFLPGTNTLRATFSDISIESNIEGAVYALWFIPLRTSDVNITNLTLQVDLTAVVNGDQVNW